MTRMTSATQNTPRLATQDDVKKAKYRTILALAAAYAVQTAVLVYAISQLLP